MKLVLDASMALAWVFERQKKEEARAAEKILTSIIDCPTIVPSLWHAEIVNALLVGERRKVISEAEIADYLARLARLPIITDDATPSRREVVMALAREHDLTAYDSTYLDLALRTNAILATFDNKLSKAMQKAGGKVLL